MGQMLLETPSHVCSASIFSREEVIRAPGAVGASILGDVVYMAHYGEVDGLVFVSPVVQSQFGRCEDPLLRLKTSPKQASVLLMRPVAVNSRESTSVASATFLCSPRWGRRQ